MHNNGWKKLMMETDWLAEEMERQEINVIVGWDMHDITHFLSTHHNQSRNDSSEEIQSWTWDKVTHILSRK